jgi:hypothetical protein
LVHISFNWYMLLAECEIRMPQCSNHFQSGNLCQGTWIAGQHNEWGHNATLCPHAIWCSEQHQNMSTICVVQNSVNPGLVGGLRRVSAKRMLIASVTFCMDAFHLEPRLLWAHRRKTWKLKYKQSFQLYSSLWQLMQMTWSNCMRT